MLRKIVSNGRTGVARGALEAARVLDIPHGGWILSDEVAGDQFLPDRYHLQEMKTHSLAKCVERNVKDADGTLVFTFTDEWPDDALCARKIADKLHMPWMQINLGRTGEFEAAQIIHEWIKEQEIRVMHVVGDAQETPGKNAGEITASLLEAVYYLGLIESNMASPSHLPVPEEDAPPESIDDIVSRLSGDMTLKDRVIVANLQESQLELLQPTLGRYILAQLEHWETAYAPAFSIAGLEAGLTGADDACMKVLKQLWKKLRVSHRLRRIK